MTFIVDGTNGLTFPNSTTQASAGSVIQIVNGQYSAQTGNTTSTFADTGLTLSITPKFSTSKILICATISGLYKDTNNTYMELRVLRNSTAITNMDMYAAQTLSSAATGVASSSLDYLDSPNTTSSTTYKIQFRSVNNVGFCFVHTAGSVSSITLMEIAQ
jgi:hypothetical protein